MQKVQLRCMNEHCGIIFSTNGRNLDGLSCVECYGPLLAEPYNPNVEHTTYNIKNMKSFVHYRCLCCGHEEKVNMSNEEYAEVKVCPECNGAWVDKFRVGKYIKKTNRKRNIVDLPYLSDKISITIHLPKCNGPVVSYNPNLLLRPGKQVLHGLKSAPRTPRPPKPSSQFRK